MGVKFQARVFLWVIDNMKLHQISPPIMCTASTPLGGIQGGYYTVASRYEFYVQVAWTISHEWAQRTSEILFLPWEDFRPLSEDFWRFSKIVPKARRTFPTFSENFRKFPKISEDFQRLLRKTRRCFDDTPTNLSTIKETNLISVKSSISSHVKISYLHMWGYRIFFINLLSLGIPLTFIL